MDTVYVPEVTARIPPITVIGMAGSTSSVSDYYSCVLYSIIRIIQFRPYGSNFRSLRVLEHCFDPIVRNNLNVAIH